MAVTERGIQIRIRFFGALFVLAFCVIVGRSYYLHVVQAPKLQDRADQQKQRVVELAPQRGAIFDRNGDPLAISLDVQSLYADPFQIKDPAKIAAALSKPLQMKAKELTSLLASKKRFVWIKRKLDPEVAKEIRDLRLPGIRFVAEHKRFYPQGGIGAHVVGFTGLDPKGLEGVELEYDQQLQGEPGRMMSQRDARGRGMATAEQLVQGGVPGYNLQLTLDRSLQYIAEKELARVIKEFKAKSGTVVVMEPASGKILAMASQPDYNPNSPGKSRTSSRRNRTVTDMYEPGSTFKPFLLAGALEEKIVRPNQKIYCENGRYEVGGKVIRDTKKHRKLNLTEMLKYSSNIGFAKLGKAMERERFYSYLTDFGFGELTGVDLPGESPGLVRQPSRWFEIDLAAISFGQAISVTPIQIASAMSAIANGGLLMEPYLVERVTDADGQVVQRKLPQVKRRVISEATAKTVREMMVSVTEPGGTGTRAALPGYRVAGKTGTAQKVDPVTGGYSIDKRVASFIGFVPADSPALVVSVTVDEPEGKGYGGVVAGPVFARIAEQSLNHLNILPKGSLSAIDLAKADVEPLPDLAALLPEAEPIDGLVMPDFRGMSYRQVLQAMQEKQLNLKLSGSGQVVEQSPAPGRKIRYGKQAWVRLGA
ncbi:peptidoglycan synthetase FtsI [Malonomonas rubra DSM 5091]|uniref:Peptidoglycan synthetase FtsI n=1 Tax=Malonomonas rubra DSM 5091 TaxID=1122189 RepID=A0A1M6E6K2_MALRU|nr:penicillin-binding protein [Malonomonas rubra]SHI80990.1 peptidoglycan synthetase FtsI [Malonomonas rubra DSM 5091]